MYLSMEKQFSVICLLLYPICCNAEPEKGCDYDLVFFSWGKETISIFSFKQQQMLQLTFKSLHAETVKVFLQTHHWVCFQKVPGFGTDNFRFLWIDIGMPFTENALNLIEMCAVIKSFLLQIDEPMEVFEKSWQISFKQSQCSMNVTR